MIIVMKPKAADKNIKAVTQYIEAKRSDRTSVPGRTGYDHRRSR